MSPARLVAMLCTALWITRSDAQLDLFRAGNNQRGKNPPFLGAILGEPTIFKPSSSASSGSATSSSSSSSAFGTSGSSESSFGAAGSSGFDWTAMPPFPRSSSASGYGQSNDFQRPSAFSGSSTTFGTSGFPGIASAAAPPFPRSPSDSRYGISSDSQRPSDQKFDNTKDYSLDSSSFGYDDPVVPATSAFGSASSFSGNEDSVGYLPTRTGSSFSPFSQNPSSSSSKTSTFDTDSFTSDNYGDPPYAPPSSAFDSPASFPSSGFAISRKVFNPETDDYEDMPPVSTSSKFGSSSSFSNADVTAFSPSKLDPTLFESDEPPIQADEADEGESTFLEEADFEAPPSFKDEVRDELRSPSGPDDEVAEPYDVPFSSYGADKGYGMSPSTSASEDVYELTSDKKDDTSDSFIPLSEFLVTPENVYEPTSDKKDDTSDSFIPLQEFMETYEPGSTGTDFPLQPGDSEFDFVSSFMPSKTEINSRLSSQTQMLPTSTILELGMPASLEPFKYSPPSIITSLNGQQTSVDKFVAPRTIQLRSDSHSSNSPTYPVSSSSSFSNSEAEEIPESDEEDVTSTQSEFDLPDKSDAFSNGGSKSFTDSVSAADHDVPFSDKDISTISSDPYASSVQDAGGTKLTPLQSGTKAPPTLSPNMVGMLQLMEKAIDMSIEESHKKRNLASSSISDSSIPSKSPEIDSLPDDTSLSSLTKSHYTETDTIANSESKSFTDSVSAADHDVPFSDKDISTLSSVPEASSVQDAGGTKLTPSQSGTISPPTLSPNMVGMLQLMDKVVGMSIEESHKKKDLPSVTNNSQKAESSFVSTTISNPPEFDSSPDVTSSSSTKQQSTETDSFIGSGSKSFPDSVSLADNNAPFPDQGIPKLSPNPDSSSVYTPDSGSTELPPSQSGNKAAPTLSPNMLGMLKLMETAIDMSLKEKNEQKILPSVVGSTKTSELPEIINSSKPTDPETGLTESSETSELNTANASGNSDSDLETSSSLSYASETPSSSITTAPVSTTSDTFTVTPSSETSDSSVESPSDSDASSSKNSYSSVESSSDSDIPSSKISNSSVESSSDSDAPSSKISDSSVESSFDSDAPSSRTDSSIESSSDSDARSSEISDSSVESSPDSDSPSSRTTSSSVESSSDSDAPSSEISDSSGESSSDSDAPSSRTTDSSVEPSSDSDAPSSEISDSSGESSSDSDAPSSRTTDSSVETSDSDSDAPSSRTTDSSVEPSSDSNAPDSEISDSSVESSPDSDAPSSRTTDSSVETSSDSDAPASEISYSSVESSPDSDVPSSRTTDSSVEPSSDSDAPASEISDSSVESSSDSDASNSSVGAAAADVASNPSTNATTVNSSDSSTVAAVTDAKESPSATTVTDAVSDSSSKAAVPNENSSSSNTANDASTSSPIDSAPNTNGRSAASSSSSVTANVSTNTSVTSNGSTSSSVSDSGATSRSKYITSQSNRGFRKSQMPRTFASARARARSSPKSKKRLICLFNSQEYYKEGFTPALIDPQYCTHINYEFAFLDGTTYQLIIGDPKLDIQENFYEMSTTNLKQKKPDLKVMLSMGGWADSTKKYSLLAADPNKRKNFISTAIPLLQQHGFDGLDIAWEYPNCWQGAIGISPADKENFATLLQEIRNEFDKYNLLISVSVASVIDEIVAAYNVPEMSRAVHWMNVMTYDMHGAWEHHTKHHAQFKPIPTETNRPYMNMQSSCNEWVARGASRAKLNVGIPSYGRSCTLTDPSQNGMGAAAKAVGKPGPNSREGGYLMFNEICLFVKNESWTTAEDQYSGPYAYKGDQWVGYDSIESACAKTKYAMEQGFGGILFKDLSADDYKGLCFNTTFPLLAAIRSEMDKEVDVVSS